jgi:hypothetical protein
MEYNCNLHLIEAKNEHRYLARVLLVKHLLITLVKYIKDMFKITDSTRPEQLLPGKKNMKNILLDSYSH